MKRIIYLLLLLAPIFSRAQVTDANLNLEADTIRLETLAGHNTAKRVGRMFKNIISNKWNISSLTNTGTSGAASYNFGTGVLNIPVYPGGGGITNVASNLELMMSDGTNATHSGFFNSGVGAANLTLGGGATIGATRVISTNGSGSDIDIQLSPKGNGRVQFGSSVNIQVGGSVGINTFSGGLNGAFTLYSWDGNGSSAGSSSSNDITIKTGNGGTGGTTNSGNINLTTGTPNSGGTQGKILVNALDYFTKNPVYTTITCSGNWSNLTAGYYTDKFGRTYLKGAIIVSGANFPSTGAATANGAIPSANHNGSYSVAVYRANGSYYVGTASVSISTLGAITVDGFSTTASSSSTGTVGVNVTLSNNTDDVVVYLDTIIYW